MLSQNFSSSSFVIRVNLPGWWVGGGWTGMLVASLRGVNLGFSSRLGCSGQNVIIFNREGLVKGYTRRNNKTERILILYFTLLGVCISFGHTHSIWESPPPGDILHP